MGPHVSGEADVEQVLERHPTDGRTERERQVLHRGWGTPPALDGLGAHGLEFCDEFGVRQMGAFADLQLVETVDPVVGVDLFVERHAAPELVGELFDRGLRLARPEYVQRHVADVPRRAISG